jgi:hypothetical protein
MFGDLLFVIGFGVFFLKSVGVVSKIFVSIRLLDIPFFSFFFSFFNILLYSHSLLLHSPLCFSSVYVN